MRPQRVEICFLQSRAWTLGIITPRRCCVNQTERVLVYTQVEYTHSSDDTLSIRTHIWIESTLRTHDRHIHNCHAMVTWPTYNSHAKGTRPTYNSHATVTWPTYNSHAMVTWRTHNYHAKVTWSTHISHAMVTWPTYNYHATVTWPTYIAPHFEQKHLPSVEAVILRSGGALLSRRRWAITLQACAGESLLHCVLVQTWPPLQLVHNIAWGQEGVAKRGTLTYSAHKNS